MPKLSSVFKNLFAGDKGKDKKETFKNIQRGIDPTELWDEVGELGDGAYGTVYKVSHVVLFLIIYYALLQKSIPGFFLMVLGFKLMG